MGSWTTCSFARSNRTGAREEQEARFYGSSEWRSGPREEIVSRIESDHTVVLTLTADAVDALRTAAV